VTGAAVRAANQNILGSQLQLKNPSSIDKRKILGKAKEKASTDTLVGNPTVSGATLTVRANGGTPSEQTFNLAQGTSPSTGKQYWTGDNLKGFKYKDSKFENGTAIKAVQIKKSPKGVFLVKVLGNSKVNAISVLPPNLGSSGCILLAITGGDSYSIAFPLLDGVVKNKGPLEYSHKKVSVQGSCTTSTTTTSTTTTSTTTTSTTIPACSPNCPIGNPCFAPGQCASGTCVSGVCKCPNHSYTFVVNSNSGGAFDSAEWPGGTATQTNVTGCSATINQPTGNIDLVCTLAGAFSVNSFAGYSNCFGQGGEDGDGCKVNSCPPLGIGSCCNARPSCSAALNGSGQSQYTVQCLQ
jgi:hypothetical protein